MHVRIESRRACEVWLGCNSHLMRQLTTWGSATVSAMKVLRLYLSQPLYERRKPCMQYDIIVWASRALLDLDVTYTDVDMLTSAPPPCLPFPRLPYSRLSDVLWFFVRRNTPHRRSRRRTAPWSTSWGAAGPLLAPGRFAPPAAT